MKLSEEQIENMEWEDMEKIIKDAIESRDMEFITSTLPYVDAYFMLDGDYFVSNFDHDIFKDRDMALHLAELAQIMPKDLYENDEEMILTTVSAPSGQYRGFYLASDELLNNKEFVKKMFDSIDDYEVLAEILQYDLNPEWGSDLLPKQVLEGGEIEQFVKDRIQELEEKEEQEKIDAVYEEMSELEERRMDYYGEYSSQRKFYPSFLDFLKEKELSADGAEKSVIQDLIRSEENDKSQSEETSETSSELEQLASTKKELEQIVSELRENIASAQKLLASYEELLNGGKQNDSNEGQTFGEE